MKKHILSMAVALTALSIFTACDDKTDCGCECNMPVIDRVELLSDSTHANLIGTSISAGQSIVVMGSNLGDVMSIVVGNKVASLKPAYRTDNTLVFTIPTVSKSCTAKFITKGCTDGYVINQLNIAVGAPEAYMFYNEFVPDGGTLKVKGVNFVGDSIKVAFFNNDGTWHFVDESNGVELQDPEEGTEVWVKVPDGTAAGYPVYFVNTAEDKDSKSKILLRDNRNILTDFEYKNDDYEGTSLNNNLNFVYSAGIIAKATDGSYVIADTCEAYIKYELQDVPENYHAYGTANQYGVLDGLHNWECVSWLPNLKGVRQDLSVFGPFADTATGKLEKYCLKFEMYVPSTHPSDGALITINFQKGNVSSWDFARSFCGVLQMSECSWDNSSDDWSIKSCSSFSTDGWMTVTIPFSDLKWNIKDKNYVTSAKHFILGSWDGVDETGLAEAAKVFGDGKDGVDPNAHDSYAAVNTDPEDTQKWGGLLIGMNSYDKARDDEDVCILIDNVRVVPYDGNGAIYPRMSWGKPSQHYSKVPREKAYVW